MLAKLLDFLLRLLMPVLPYTVEEVFQAVREPLRYPQPSSLLLTLESFVLPPAREVFGPEWKALKREVNRFVELERSDTLKSAAQLDLLVQAPEGAGLDEQTLVDFFGCAHVTLTAGPVLGASPTRTLRPMCARCRRHDDTALEGLCLRCAAVEQLAEKAAATQAEVSPV